MTVIQQRKEREAYERTKYTSPYTQEIQNTGNHYTISFQKHVATQSTINLDDYDSWTQTRCDELEHDDEFYPTKKRKRSLQTKPSTPPHTHKNSKTLGTITEQ